MRTYFQLVMTLIAVTEVCVSVCLGLLLFARKKDFASLKDEARKNY